MTTRKGTMVSDSEVLDGLEGIAEILESPEEESLQEFPKPANINEPIFEGGPPLAQINAWKDQFGDVYITSLSATRHIIWRTLTRFEYRRLVKQMEQATSGGMVSQAEALMNQEEMIAELCILFPPLSRAELASQQAGVASLISQEVMDASGFQAQDVRVL